MRGLLLAGLAAVTGTQAQVRDTAPVTVEVIGTGAVEIKATAEHFPISYSGHGATAAAAQAALVRKEADVLRLLAAEGVPASSVTELPVTERAKLSMLGGLGGGAISDPSADESATTPSEEAQGGRTVEVPTLTQATTLTARLRAMGVLVGDATPSFQNVAGARRDARLAALTDARAGAGRYAAALGMKVGDVTRVSETGGGAMLPGLQEKIATLFATGSPSLMQQMLQPPKEVAKVEEAVVVEFTLIR